MSDDVSDEAWAKSEAWAKEGGHDPVRVRILEGIASLRSDASCLPRFDLYPGLRFFTRQSIVCDDLVLSGLQQDGAPLAVGYKL